MIHTTPIEIALDDAVRLLEPLSEEDRLLIDALYKIKSQAEIAKTLGWTRSKVWHRIQELKNRLRQL